MFPATMSLVAMYIIVAKPAEKMAFCPMFSALSEVCVSDDASCAPFSDSSYRCTSNSSAEKYFTVS